MQQGNEFVLRQGTTSCWVPAELSHLRFQQMIDKEGPVAWRLHAFGLSHVHAAVAVRGLPLGLAER